MPPSPRGGLEDKTSKIAMIELELEFGYLSSVTQLVMEAQG